MLRPCLLMNQLAGEFCTDTLHFAGVIYLDFWVNMSNELEGTWVILSWPFLSYHRKSRLCG